MRQRNSTRPPIAAPRAVSELDDILLDYVLDQPAKPAPCPRRRAESVERSPKSNWSFEQAALRQSLRIHTPWFVDDDDERVAG